MRYDYKCLSCDHVQEVDHPISQKYEGDCPKCGSSMKKLLSGGLGTILKGSNWTRDSKIKRDLKRKNDEAGERMKNNKRPVTKLSDLKGDGLT